MKSRGLSLIETILSLALLSLVLIFVLNLFPTAMTTLRTVERNHELDQRARGLLELYANDNLALGEHPLPTFPLESWEVRPTLTVEAYKDHDPKLLVLMRLRLSWQDDRKQERALVRETLVSRLRK